MRLKASQLATGELFRPRFGEQINMRHPLVQLAGLIDWVKSKRIL